ncbi:MAG: DUF3131 domain-containing protein, partial [Candidatus Omnitrophica bacterium]|nr:DUF3131 domain-containing protein [Candidatus Omnitrophota bacterium]
LAVPALPLALATVTLALIANVALLMIFKSKLDTVRDITPTRFQAGLNTFVRAIAVSIGLAFALQVGGGAIAATLISLGVIIATGIGAGIAARSIEKKSYRERWPVYAGGALGILAGLGLMTLSAIFGAPSMFSMSIIMPLISAPIAVIGIAMIILQVVQARKIALEAKRAGQSYWRTFAESFVPSSRNIMMYSMSLPAAFILFGGLMPSLVFVAAVSIGTFLVNRYSVNIEKATGRRVSETISGMSSQALMLSAGITPMVVYPQAAYSAQAQNAKAALREGAVSQATVAANKSISAYSSQQFAGFERLGRNIGNVVNDVMDGHIATIAEVAQPAVKIVEAEVIADRLAAQRAEFEKFKAKLAAEQADEVKVKAEVEAIKAKVTAQEAAALKPTLIPMGFPVWGTSVVNDPSDATKYLRAGAPLGSKNKNDEGYAFARNGVMAPHAIFLALDVAPSEAMSNINEMLRLYPQIFGKYGAYDSVNAKTGAVSSQYVAVNQAMSFIAMVNYIKDGTIQDRFASNARVSKSLGLLGEKFEKIDDPSGLSLDRDISDKDRKRLNGIAEKTWGYFRDNVNAGTNWLPPNKIDSGVAATYTSVTDIGLYLTSVVGAKEMGFITEAEAKTRIANTINTLKKLDKWNGLFRNYYHTDDLESVTKGDRHISTVDNGWLAAGLIVAGETFPEFKSTADAIVADMKFDSLYDRNERKFANGYDENTGLTKSHYGLIYTEIRPTLLIAIGKGDIGKEAWANTPKTLPEERDWQAQKPDGPYYKHHIDTTEGVKTAYFIPSWDGSMFEGLMPNLYVNNRVFSPNGYAKQDAMYVFLQKYFAKGLDARAPPQIQQAKAETLPAHVKREMPQFADLADALKYARENNTAVASRISAVANFINQ